MKATWSSPCSPWKIEPSTRAHVVGHLGGEVLGAHEKLLEQRVRGGVLLRVVRDRVLGPNYLIEEHDRPAIEPERRVARVERNGHGRDRTGTCVRLRTPAVRDRTHPIP
jgi:hypothetical protein